MKPCRTGLVGVALTVLAAGCTIAEQERTYRNFFNETAQAYVPGFRLPDESEYGPAWALVEGQGWQTQDGSGQTKAEFWTSGEFNGDETMDYAYILVDEAAETRTLFAFVSTAGGYEVERLDEGFEWGIWLQTRPPGRYATAAASSAGPDSPDNVLELRPETRQSTSSSLKAAGRVSSGTRRGSPSIASGPATESSRTGGSQRCNSLRSQDRPTLCRPPLHALVSRAPLRTF